MNEILCSDTCQSQNQHSLSDEIYTDLQTMHIKRVLQNKILYSPQLRVNLA